MPGIFRYKLGADYGGVGDGELTDLIGEPISNKATGATFVGVLLPSWDGIYYWDGGPGGVFDTYGNAFQPLNRANAGYLFDFSASSQSATFVGGDRGDVLAGGSSLDTLRGGGGNDKIYGNHGGDVLDGGGGNDVVDGGNDNDLLIGRDGTDQLSGGSGDDHMLGGSGNDRLIGNAGRDVMEGGIGRDNFIYIAPTESAITAQWRDVILDFAKGQDIITFSPIDANAGTPANDAFVFLGKGVSNTPLGTGRVRYHWEDYAGTENDKTVIRLNTDADAAIEMSIELTGLITLNTSDFVL